MTDAPPPPPQTPYSTVQPLSPSDEKLWSTLTHIGGIFFSVLAPLITYLVFKDRGAFVRHHTAQALNFQITLLIAYVVSSILFFVIIGFFLIVVVAIIGIVFPILAAVAANKGEWYRYPVAIPMVK
ncbi:DUF4870 domain-containing protein [Lysobacter korlensis]|uniref:DUF4870 domain-containing protein n=1 Tax=Lysobacter korlensis TaxID=553636 RepID=A0ABV6RNT9_9GAMM